jgi:hypothetical protein
MSEAAGGTNRSTAYVQQYMSELTSAGGSAATGSGQQPTGRGTPSRSSGIGSGRLPLGSSMADVAGHRVGGSSSDASVGRQQGGSQGIGAGFAGLFRRGNGF